MLQNYLRLIRFDKPIGTLLLLWPTLCGLWLAYRGIPPLKILLTFSLGVFLTRSAGCAINDYADAEFDGLVARTAQRPLATGAITRHNALLVTFGLSLLAFILAWLNLQPVTLVWSIPALILFISYPFFKRFFAIPQLYLGIAFSFGILMAFIEQSNHLPLIAIILFGANLSWVIAYDTIYALVDLDDDLKIGIKTSAITFGNKVIQIIMCCYALFLGLLILIGYLAQLKFSYYLGVVIILALIIYVYQQIKLRQRTKCFNAFLFNNYIGLILFIAIVTNFSF